MTWDNHRSGSNHVKSALDKGIVNGDWLHLFPKAVLCSSPMSNSDHRPLCLDSGGTPPKFKRCFKFEEGWTRDERSKLVVANAWKTVEHPWAPASAFKKIGATRVALLQWNRTQFERQFIGSKGRELIGSRMAINALNSSSSLLLLEEEEMPLRAF
ncbi:hypothetical protein CsatA_016248 [Cannabis sativa]